MNKHVLVVADLQTSQPVALQKARDFVGHTDTRISILAFLDSSRSSKEDIPHGDRLAALEESATRALGHRPHLDLDIVSTPDIARYCARFCQQKQVDLVIKTGHRSESMTHTPLDWELIRSLRCPVIIAVDHPLSAERKLLVTLDVLSHSPLQKALDQKVLNWCTEWLREAGFSLYIACCVEAADPLTNTDIQLLMELEDKMRPRIEPVILQMIDGLGLSCKGILIAAGTPTTVLKRLADELDADLVATGFTARHGLGELLLGHTAEKLMRKLQRNMVVVPDLAPDNPEAH